MKENSKSFFAAQINCRRKKEGAFSALIELLAVILRFPKKKSTAKYLLPQHVGVKPAGFTLIKLLVVSSQHCRHFFKRFICTDKYGCVRKHTENAARPQGRTSRFFCGCKKSSSHLHIFTRSAEIPGKADRLGKWQSCFAADRAAAAGKEYLAYRQ